MRFKIYTSFKDLPESWNNLVGHDILLERGYLQALEEASPETISLYYIGVFVGDDLVGVALIQRVQVYAKDVFRSNKSSVLKQVLKTGVARLLKGNVLVVGNLTHTGQHGLYFDKNKISQGDYLNIIFEASEELESLIRTHQNKRIRMYMFKDYFVNDDIHLEHNFFQSHKLHKVNVQPNMIMQIRSNWTVFDDYVASFNKKYRARYRRARKKLGNISCKELNYDEIKANSEHLHELYLIVSDNAKFNTFLLPNNHFVSLKRNLKEKFKIFGYYHNDQLIGFFSLILNHDVLETYFLGYDEEHQYNNQLYLNMLYDMAKFGIDNKFKSIVYARTAMEIKSSIGAEKIDMIMYMKHSNRIANALLKQLFNLMNPKLNWVERHPFKT